MTQVHRPGSAALLRGGSIALLTATLAAAAHSSAGGVPSGGGFALVVLIAATVGAVNAFSASGGGTRAVTLVLTVGQVLGHVALGCGGHAHTGQALPSPAMMGAHAAAVVFGALLIAAGSRFCVSLTTAIRALVTESSPPFRVVRPVATTSDQPLLSLVLVASSLSYRGPPVGLFS